MPLGNGTITNIFGWRRIDLDARTDLDSSDLDVFLGDAYFEQEQFSNEFRYFGSFLDDRVDLTAGLYWFDQDIGYWERRMIFRERHPVYNPALPLCNVAEVRASLNNIPGLPELCVGVENTETYTSAWHNSWVDSALGGSQDQTTRGAFIHADVHATPSVTFNLGVRYTYEKKQVDIATFDPGAFMIEAVPGLTPIPIGDSRCDFNARTCNFNYSDEHSWNNWTPKVGVQYHASDAVNLYAFWTKGFRSGGYNFRHTDPDIDRSRSARNGRIPMKSVPKSIGSTDACAPIWHCSTTRWTTCSAKWRECIPSRARCRIS